MDKEKDQEFEPAPAKEDFAETASRARNRTVMLTPEMTSQVRSRFQQEHHDAGHQPPAPPARPAQGFESPRYGGNNGGFESPRNAGYQSQPRAQESYDAGTARAANQGALPAPGPATSNASEFVSWTKESPVIGFLVSYDVNPNGSVFELRSGRLIVTNVPSPGENSLVLKDTSVSSMHAIIRVAASGQIQVLDQLSEFGTKIKRADSGDEDTLSGEKSTVEHGDVLSFGSRNFHVCVVPRSDK